MRAFMGSFDKHLQSIQPLHNIGLSKRYVPLLTPEVLIHLSSLRPPTHRCQTLPHLCRLLASCRQLGRRPCRRRLSLDNNVFHPVTKDNIRQELSNLFVLVGTSRRLVVPAG